MGPNSESVINTAEPEVSIQKILKQFSMKMVSTTGDSGNFVNQEETWKLTNIWIKSQI